MGVPLPWPSFVLDDMINLAWPELILKKKSNSNFYHAVRESVVMGKMLTGHVPSNLNFVGLLTKIFFESLHTCLVGRIFDNIYDVYLKK